MMYLWEFDIQESVVFKPLEIRGKKGRKKMKKANAAIYIPNMDADNFEKICNEKGLQFVYVEVPEHGRLIDGDKVFKRLQKQAMSVWGDGNPRYQIVLEVMDAIRFAPTILPAEEGEG